jgi:hypothetical protein
MRNCTACLTEHSLGSFHFKIPRSDHTQSDQNTHWKHYIHIERPAPFSRYLSFRTKSRTPVSNLCFTKTLVVKYDTYTHRFFNSATPPWTNNVQSMFSAQSPRVRLKMELIRGPFSSPFSSDDNASIEIDVTSVADQIVQKRGTTDQSIGSPMFDQYGGEINGFRLYLGDTFGTAHVFRIRFFVLYSKQSDRPEQDISIDLQGTVSLEATGTKADGCPDVEATPQLPYT